VAEKAAGDLGSSRCCRATSQFPEFDSLKFVADKPPSRQKGGNTIATRRNVLWSSASRTRSENGREQTPKMKGGMNHDSEIFPAKHYRSGYRVDVSIAACGRGMLDDLPSWINNNNSERSGDSRCNRDSGINRLTGSDNGQKTRSNGQSLTYSSAGKAEGRFEPS
jgi:hypothetical protein